MAATPDQTTVDASTPSPDILACAVEGCDFSCSSLDSLHGHYHAIHHPEGWGETVDERRTAIMNRYFRSLDTDERSKEPLTFPF